MSTPTNPLAGDPFPQQPPVTAPVDATVTVAPPIDALSGAPVPPPFAQSVAVGADKAAASMPPRAARQPGAWARSLVAGVQNALAGFGAGGRVPEGAGGLYGVGAAARQQQAVRAARQERQDKLNQEQSEQQRQDAIAKATIAHENAATTHDQMLNAQLGYQARQQNITVGKAALAPLQQAGAPIIQDGLDSDEVQNLIKEKKLDPTQQHAFATGEKPILGADGKEELDPEGRPLTRPTYTVIGDVPEVTLDAATAKLISDNTPYKLSEGTKLSGIAYGSIIQQAASAQTATAAINEARKENQLKELDTDQKLAATNMLPDWNAALAKAGNDPSRALHYMQTNPQMKSKYPNAATTVQGLYGGPDKWQDMLSKQAEQRIQQQTLADKEKLKGNDFEGDPDAATSQQFLESLNPTERGVVELIGTGRAPINSSSYLIARKPEVLSAVEKAYPDFDASKVLSYQKTYEDFTSGKTSVALNSAGTALLHLQELRALNTNGSRIYGTKAYQAYKNKVDTVAPELARFYGNNTEEGIASYKKTLESPFNRDAAILTQAKSMGDKLDQYGQQWHNAAPSKAYQAPLPGISDAAKKARAAMDPDYSHTLMSQTVRSAAPTATGPNGQKITWNGAQWVPLQ